MKLDVVKLASGKKAGAIELADEYFAAEVRGDLMFRYVNWQLAKRRAGTHKVKERNEIARTGQKFGRQKGGGGARHGSKRSNVFRGGGIVHGPRVRSHEHGLQKKVRRAALLSAFSSKVAENQLIVIESAEMATHKTKDLKAALVKLKAEKALIMDAGQIDKNLQLAADNLICVDCLVTDGANVYDILRHDNLILTKAAVEALSARFAAQSGAEAEA